VSHSFSSSACSTAKWRRSWRSESRVAFDAQGDDRDTADSFSMTRMRPSYGLTANATFEPPVSTPPQRFAQDRDRTLSQGGTRGRSGCARRHGDRSTVLHPMGSRFSRSRTMCKMSLRSLTTHLVLFPDDDRLLEQDSLSAPQFETPRGRWSRTPRRLYAMPPPLAAQGEKTAVGTVASRFPPARQRLFHAVGNARARGFSSRCRPWRGGNNSRSSAMSMARCEAPIISTVVLIGTASRARSSAV